MVHLILWGHSFLLQHNKKQHLATRKCVIGHKIISFSKTEVSQVGQRQESRKFRWLRQRAFWRNWTGSESLESTMTVGDTHTLHLLEIWGKEYRVHVLWQPRSGILGNSFHTRMHAHTHTHMHTHTHTHAHTHIHTLQLVATALTCALRVNVQRHNASVCFA